ncbi:MAG: restriction endonuclease [Acutalibacter sp.]|nr:restriction endonuclease [Acutalibacter sp.]
MDRQYWLHRISHESGASYPLLEAGWLSTGWHYLSGAGLLELAEKGDAAAFEQAAKEHGSISSNKWSLWRFLRFQKGDRVVVPMSRAFAVAEVTGSPILAADFPGPATAAYAPTAEGLTDPATGELYDLGFLAPVKLLTPPPGHLPRSYAEARLVSRMKVRQTNTNIEDLAELVERALKTTGPVTIHDALVDATAQPIMHVIQEKVTDKKLEQLLIWYMKKKGASRAYHPAENEPGKTDGADADVIAEFEDLKLVFYIQAKKHWTGTVTSQWSVRQVSGYREQMQGPASGYTYISWVVSTARFSEAAAAQAAEKGVRLIDGDEFVRMLLDCGIHDVDSVFTP